MHRKNIPKEEAFWNVGKHQQILLKWCNYHLKQRGFYIQSILDLQDGVCIIILLELLTGRNIFDCNLNSSGFLERKENEGSSKSIRHWKIIELYFKDEFMEILCNLQDSSLQDEERVRLLTYLLWRIALRYQINEDFVTRSGKHVKCCEVDVGSIYLLKWINSKIAPGSTVSNWKSDWVDGIYLCKLLNAISPDTIPEAMFQSNTRTTEMITELACTSAEETLGIPRIISPTDISKGKIDGKFMMTFLSLFRNAENMIRKGIDPKKKQHVNLYTSVADSYKENVEYEKTFIYQVRHFVAFGSGLCWAQVGESAEFFIKSTSVSMTEGTAGLSVSIECHPFDIRPVFHNPSLQIKPIDETTYLVRYTPTRPGEYLIHILSNDKNIANSPFRLNITETMLEPSHFEGKAIVVQINPEDMMLPRSSPPSGLQQSLSETTPSFIFDDSRHESAFVDENSIQTPSDAHSGYDDSTTPPPWLHGAFHELFESLVNHSTLECSLSEESMKAFGRGLHFGVVGRISTFYAHTPNTDKGPLGVSITCPAMSIPVPCVKTKFNLTHFAHEVLYIPTESGIYEVTVKWGKLELPGSPFRLTVIENDVNENDVNENDNLSYLPSIQRYRDTSMHEFYLYYSATSKDVSELERKVEMFNLLHKKYPFDKIIPIAIDIELSRIEREKLYRSSNTRILPFVFINDTFLGTYHEIMKENDSVEGLAVFRRGSLSLKTGLPEA